MRKPNVFSILIAIIAVLAGVTVAYSLGFLKKTPERKISDGSTGISVETTSLKVNQEPTPTIGYGVIQPRISVGLPAEVSGKVVYRNPALEVGNSIASGEVLFRIDTEAYRYRIEFSQAQVSQFKSQLEALDKEVKGLIEALEINIAQVELQKLEMDRYKRLVKENASSKSQIEKVMSAYQNAKSAEIKSNNSLIQAKARKQTLLASLAQVEASLDEAKLNLSRTEILSPFNGKIDARNVELGEYVNPGQVLCELHDPATYEVESPLSLNDLLWLSQGNKITNITGTEAQIKLRHPNNISKTCVWKGKVTRVNSKVDAQTRTFGVFVKALEQLPQQSDFIFPISTGLFVQVVFLGGQQENLFKIPRHLVSADSNINIFKNGKLHICPVTVEKVEEGFAYIKGDLKDDDQLVLTSLSRVIEGMSLKKINIEKNKKTIVPTQESNTTKKDRG